MQNWRQAVKTPTAYRVGNNTIRLQTNFVATVSVIGVVLLVILYLLFPQSRSGLSMTNDSNGSDFGLGHSHVKYARPRYNSTYPLTAAKKSKYKVTYKIGVISDLDTNSKSNGEKDTWISYMKIGYLTYNIATQTVDIEWEPNTTNLRSSISLGGRGMELSELVVFNGKLYSADDRTGIIYQIMGDQVIPWVILSDGDGKQSKGFKSEWMTVKNEELYVGGLGKEWTSPSGDLLNLNPQWIKIISPFGEVRHVDWHENYNSLRKAANINYPGYVIHESAVWSNVHQKWFFLPRRASRDRYDEKLDENRGTNLLLHCPDSFDDINVHRVGELNPTRGFSSFKFIPDTDDKIIVALKSEEIDKEISTFILVFSTDGKILLPERRIGNVKYEGIEFI